MADHQEAGRAAPFQYRKKPVVIEAFQFQQPTSVDEAPEWLMEAVARRDFLVVDGIAHIVTLEGVMTAQPSNWIIRGVKGEIYPCKPDIFAATYEPVAAVAVGAEGLPALPQGDEAGMFAGSCIVYTADQMQQYACGAIAADRRARTARVVQEQHESAGGAGALSVNEHDHSEGGHVD